MKMKRAAIGVAIAAAVAVPVMAPPAHAGLQQCIATEFWNGIPATVGCVPRFQQCVATEFWDGIPATLSCL